MNIMIVTNSKYLGQTYIMLYSLFVNHTGILMDVYLPYEDLSGQELMELQKFVEGFSGKKLYPLYVGTAFKQKVVSRNGINVETYYRILGIDLLPPALERILYLDVDMVIKGSLMDLYQKDIENRPFAVCEDIYGKINGFHEANKRRLGIPGGYSYFNAGVMLYNVSYLRAHDAASRMLEAIYRDYTRYEYNDQDVMNELYYDKLLYVGWDEYNCPPAWYFIDKESLGAGELKFADYNLLQNVADRDEFLKRYQNVTSQIYENARIIHYMGNTKPWSATRELTKVYDIFDQSYLEAESAMKRYRDAAGETGESNNE